MTDARRWEGPHGTVNTKCCIVRRTTGERRCRRIVGSYLRRHWETDINYSRQRGGTCFDLSLSLSLSHVYSTCTAVHDVIIACSLRNLSSPLSVRPTRRFSYEFNNSPTAKFQLQSVSIECRRFLTAPVLYDKESSNPRRTKRLSNKYMESIFSALVGLNHQHSQWRCFVYLWLPAEVRFSARVVVISLAVWRSVKYCDKCVCLQGRF